MTNFFVASQTRKAHKEAVTLSVNGLNYITIHYAKRRLRFLLDTGASVSTIFLDHIMSNEQINSDETIKIAGIVGTTSSVGTVNLFFKIANEHLTHRFHVLRNGNQDMHGILGSDFLTKHGAIVNFEEFIISFWIDNRNISVPLESEAQQITFIPSRTEIIRYCEVSATGDHVILPEEVSEGVFVAGIIAKAENNKIPVRLLNTKTEEVQLRNFRPTIQKLSGYDLFEFGENQMSVERIDRLLDEINLGYLSKEERDSIQKICCKYADVFHLEGDALSVTNICRPKILLEDGATPVYVKPYRLPHAQKDEIHRQVDKMLKDGIIEEARSEYSSPLLIVPKKVDAKGNKKWRVVIDYRLLNKQLKCDRFPLPSVSDIFDSLSGAKIFSHLDMSNSYYQLELDPASRPCTAFTTDRNQYQMKRLPMGLKISPGIFSRAMTIAMSGLNYESCFIYLDDLIVFGNNMHQHNKNLIKVLERLRKVNLKLNPNKCEFFKREILYLGHIISSEGILPDPKKTLAIEKYPIPKTADETKRFVAFANYYRKYIPNFADMAEPLTRLSKKGVAFEWNASCQEAFEKLKQALSNPPVLQFPDFSAENQFILKVDASGKALGAVLCNADDKPVAFSSRTLNKAEKNYCTIEKELLAVVWAVKHFRPYLFGRKFKVFSDHRPLVYLFSMTNPSSRLTKFRLALEEYDFTVTYLKGSLNVTADALSRIEIDVSELKEMCADSSQNKICVLTRNQVKNQHKQAENRSDATGRTDHPGVVELLKRPSHSVLLQPVPDREWAAFVNRYKGPSDPKSSNIGYTRSNTNCHMTNKLLYDVNSQIIFTRQNSRSTIALEALLRDLLFVCQKYGIPEICIMKNAKNATIIQEILKILPEMVNKGIKLSIIRDSQFIENEELRQIILNDFHLLPTGGHAGINRMYNNIKKYYFWPGLRSSVEVYVKCCDDCQRFKHSIPNREPMMITTTATSAFQHVYLDLVGPLNIDTDENRYILTIQCELSKFIEAYPIPNKESVTVARAFVNNFILRYGIPSRVITDQGTEFLSSVFQESCQNLGIKCLNSTAYHHETLGALENSHKSLGAYLRIQLSKQAESWTSWVPFWSFAYNTTVHTETGYTPHELVFGKTCNVPSNIENDIDPLYNFDNYPLELKYRLQTACNEARSKLVSSKSKRQQISQTKSSNITYEPGDEILLKNEIGSKLEPLFNGPYTVIEEKSPNLVIKVNNKILEVHKNRVKLYHRQK